MMLQKMAAIYVNFAPKHIPNFKTFSYICDVFI